MAAVYDCKQVWLRCACSDKTLFTLRTLIQHHEDYHQPGICSERMLLDQTARWREEWLKRENATKTDGVLFSYGTIRRRNDFLGSSITS